ncbi:MAG: hypothetical protein ACHREM_19160 [Polyangiales bacterium]
MSDRSIDLAAKVELFAAIDREVHAIEEVQARKVIDLARRLLPHLTDEDIRNPHDFPDLDDADWQYEDGVLAGVQSVRIALRALKNRMIEDS